MKLFVYIFIAISIITSAYADIKIATPNHDTPLSICPPGFIHFQKHCINNDALTEHTVQDVMRVIIAKENSVGDDQFDKYILEPISNNLKQAVYKTKIARHALLPGYGLTSQEYHLDNKAIIKLDDYGAYIRASEFDTILLYEEYNQWFVWISGGLPQKVKLIQPPRDEPVYVNGVTDVLKLIK